MKRFIPILLLLASPAFAAVGISFNLPAYNQPLMTGAQRAIPVYVTGGTTNQVNWSITGNGALMAPDGIGAGCTTNCAAVATIKATAAGGTCTVSGTVGAYSIAASVTFTLTATSVDDPTKTASAVYPICATTPFALVQPFYQQVYKGQQVGLQAVVDGQIDQAGIWSITAQPAGGNGTLADTTNRDTLFSATVSGRYTMTYTTTTGGLTATAIVYVTTQNLPSYGMTTPNKTLSLPCEHDPAITDYFTVGPSGTKTFTQIQQLPSLTGQEGGHGWIACIYNEDTTGTNPTTYHEDLQVMGTGSPTVPIWIGGVADSAGNLPIMECDHATENPGNATVLVGIGAFKLLYDSGHFNEGYELGSTGPDYVGITGLRIHGFNKGCLYYPAGQPPGTLYTATDSSGIYARAGQHTYMAGLDIDDASWGIIWNNNTTYTGRTFTRDQVIRGNHIHHFSFPGSFSTHALYMEGNNTLVEGNLIEYPQPNDNGDYIKMRGGASIIRYNTFYGALSNYVVEYPDQEDDFQYASVTDNLGVPGDPNCPDSNYCYVTSTSGNAATLAHLIANNESLSKDYNYGNIDANQKLNNSPPSVNIQYVSQSAPQECPPCTNMSDRQGRLYYWNNTVDQLGAGISTTNYNGSGFVQSPFYSQTSSFLARNIFGNDLNFPFYVTVNASAVTAFQQNMFTTGAVNITPPITASLAGWGGAAGAYDYTTEPIGLHISGATSGNFLSAAYQGIYNPASFAPIAGSPAIGAGSAITNPEIVKMPVRFQPDPVNGYMTARTDNGTTLGAVQSGPQPTLTTVTITPNPAIAPVGQPYPTYMVANATYSNGLVEDMTYRGFWFSDTYTHFSCGGYSIGDNYCFIGTAGTGTGYDLWNGVQYPFTYNVGSAPPPVVPVTITGTVTISGHVQ